MPDVYSGYTHVSDTSILANRVRQLELIISRLILRVDRREDYDDLFHHFAEPFPIYRPTKKDERDGESAQPADRNDESTDSSTQMTHQPVGSMASQHPQMPISSQIPQLQEAKAATPQPPPRPIPTRARSDTLVLDNSTGFIPASTYLPSSSVFGHVSPPSGSLMQIGSQPLDTSRTMQSSDPMNDVIMDNDISAYNQTLDFSQFTDQLVLPSPSKWQEQSNGGSAETLRADTLRAGPSSSFHTEDQRQEINPDAQHIPQFPARGSTSVAFNLPINEPYSKAPSANEHDALLALEGMALGRHHLPKSPVKPKFSG